MTLGFPSSVNVILERMKSDSQSIVPSLNPGLRDSFHRSLLTAFAGGSFEQFTQLDLLKDELFIGTATGEFLERWGSYKSITRNAASQAQGFITISGINGTFVGLGTTFSSDEGVQYSTLSNVTVTSQSINVTSIIRVGNIATVTTPSDHLLASGIEVTIAGANETDYNGTYPITVISSTEFTYTISTTPSTPATGTITAGFTTASVEVQSLTTGSNTNQGSGIALVVDTPIAGLNDTGYVQFGQLGGGTEIESDENLRVRILEAYQNPISFFNTAQITAQAKLVPGVTRVFVKRTTPDVGQVTIYFTRDNDTNIIPSLSEVTAVKNKILEIKPDFIAEADIIVSAPTPKVTNFTFSSVTPNTPAMQQAISSNLDLFFRTKSKVGENVEEVDYLTAINNTIETSTGTRVESFTLSSPTGDIIVTSSEIATLGVINF